MGAPELQADPSVARRQLRRRASAYLRPASSSDQKFFGFMISAASVARTDRVLDLACGTGSAALAFAERCAGVVGIDVVEEPLVRARAEAASRRTRNVLFALTEIERLAFNDATFDGAVCRFSFHHLVNPDRVFAEMARVVRPGGWILIADMTAPEDPAQGELHNQMERLCDPTHGRALAVSEFEQMFAAGGFKLVMKVARDSRVTVDDWVNFGGATPENAAKLRAMAADAVATGAPSRFKGEGTAIRVTHTSVTFVIEKPD
jgi:SAM-dependent methyltransferase